MTLTRPGSPAQYQVHQFTHRAVAAGGPRYHVSFSRASGRALPGAALIPAELHSGQIVHVVAHEADLIEGQTAGAPQIGAAPRPCPCSPL